jgi:PhnB protein
MSTKTIAKDPAISTYLAFGGRCEEALEFYRKALGAEIEMIMRFKDAPDSCPGITPGMENKVMHSSFRVAGAMVMASDGMCTEGAKFEGFSLSYTVPDKATADRAFTALAEGGEIQMPLAETFFSPYFGIVVDRFGVSWMVIIPQPQS